MSTPATSRFAAAVEALDRGRHLLMVVTAAALVVILTESALLKNPIVWLLVV